VAQTHRLPTLLLCGALLMALNLQAGAQPRIALIGGAEDNAFLAAASELGIHLEASESPESAEFDALMVCAPDYPKVVPASDSTRSCLDSFLADGKAVYVEYTPLPGLLGPQAKSAGYERLLVAAEAPATDGLAPLSLLEEHGSRYLPMLVAETEGARALLSYARAAGLDVAVFGAPDNTVPALVEVPRGSGRILLSSTALSNCIRGRYRPSESWATLCRSILLSLLPVEEAQAVRESFIDLRAWTEPREWVATGEPLRVCVKVAPGTQLRVIGPDGEAAVEPGEDGIARSHPMTLPDGPHTLRVLAARGETRREVSVPVEVSPRRDRYIKTVARNLKWFEEAGMLVAPDGTKGVREGLRSQISPTGRPAVAGGLRVDCVSECGLLFYLYGQMADDPKWRERGRRMLQYTARAFQVAAKDSWYFGHWQSRGEFVDGDGTVYVFSDDSGAGTLFSLLGYAATGDTAMLQAGLRGVEFFCRTASDKTGLPGGMRHRNYQGSGPMGTPWPVLRKRNTGGPPHVVNLPLASLLVAYGLTGEERYLEIARRGIGTVMDAYPDWHLVTSRTCEHGRMLLPLALLQRVDPTPKHRQWVDTILDYLASKHAPCGALMEWDGCNPGSNAAFGTAENSVFQQNGDPISDQLYGTSFALLHLWLTHQVTGDERAGELFQDLADYLTRIQLRDPDPLHDGTWLRAFDYERWEYFGSSADVGWGPYCCETGWMCAPIGLGLLSSLEGAPASPLWLPSDPDLQLKRFADAARLDAEAVEAALSAPPPDAVEGLQALPSRGPYASLTWTAPSGRHRSTEPGFAPTDENRVGVATQGQWSDWGLEPETDYYYRVLATNGIGDASGPGREVTATTGPPSKARGCRYEKSLPPYAGYADAGDGESTDGEYAGLYGDGKSYGYRLSNLGDSISLDITVDLGNVHAIGRASHHNCGAPGYRPDEMSVSLSVDGEAWTSVGATTEVSGDLMAVEFEEVSARFVRFHFTKERTGSLDDWLFIDELEVF